MVQLPSFVQEVVAARDLLVTQAVEHAWRLEPRQSVLAWHCDLDDGTSTNSERDPASFVRWVCPALRSVGRAAAPQLDVRRRGPQSDLGRAFASFGRLAGRSSGRSSGRTPIESAPGAYVYTDPHGVIEAPLRQRLEHWPAAADGNGAVRPAELWSIKVTGEGLIVESLAWWDSAAALDHQIGLAIDLADRIARQRSEA